MKKHQLFILAGLLLSAPLFSQDWVSKMQDPSVNFFEVQKTFNEYVTAYTSNYKQQNGTMPAKIPGANQFKRWEWFMAPRVAANGERFNGGAAWMAMDEYRKGIQTNAGSWTFIGPNTVGGLYGAGRLNFIRVHPTSPNTLYVGSPSGGLWISTDGGSTWTTNTDLLNQVIGCTDIAIDPTNTNIMYMATGDGDAGDTYTVGLLKSTNAAATWSPTGLSFAMGVGRTMSKVLLNPNTPNTLIVATSTGIFRTTDGGVTFTQTLDATTSQPLTVSIKDMEFKPGDPNTVYACGSSFYKSINGGATWTKITSGLPASTNVSRMAIATTTIDPTIVYLIAGLPGPNYGTEGFYKSITSGASFTKPSTPNIGTQQWYDLAIAACPTNANEILIGGQTQFMKSTNGGTSWATTGSNTHVDYHDLYYSSGTTAYVTSDGGVWKTINNGGTWTNLSNGLAISQMYGFGQSSTSTNYFIQGWQDNGTNLYNGTTWSQEIGGDGMKAFVSWGSNQNMWGSSQNGGLNRTTNGGGSWSGATSGITETGAWVTEWLEDPITATTLYTGFANVWKSTNGGASWTKPGNVAGTSTVSCQAIAVSPVNVQTIYTAKGGTLYKTVNGGTNWTAVGGGLPSGSISDIICHPTDINKVWVSFSGFSNSIKVYQTTTGGTSWTNLSASIPNIPVNCMALDKNGNDALYIGTDIGCYFKDATMTIWQPFSTGLPNVIVSQLEIFYAGNKIRASTYGRGMWESGFYTAGAYAPDANFDCDKKIGCPGLGVQFSDYSAGSPTSWSWTFQGGVPSTSTAQNPFVAYNTPGTYSVTLTVTNGVGNDTQTFTNYIVINSSPNAAPTATGDNFCAPGTAVLTASPSAPGTLRWWNQSAGGNIVGTGATFTTPVLTGTTTYYVDEAFAVGGIDFTGELDNSIGAGSMFSSDIRGLYFDVLQPVVINSVQVYSQSAGVRTIEIIDQNGNMVTDTTLMVPASPTALTTVNINRTVYAGNSYFMKFRGTVDCYRNSSGAVFPYTSSSVNVTNSNAGSAGYYYFFYNWQYTNIVCNTGRTPATATDTCTVIGINDLFVNNHIDIFPNPSNGEFTVSFNAEKQDTYTMKLTNAIGQTVREEKLENFSGIYSNKLDISSYGKGVYMLSVSNSKNETVKKVIVY